MSPNSDNTTQGGRNQQQPSTQGTMGPPPPLSSSRASSKQQNPSSAPRQLDMPYAVGTSNFLQRGEQDVQSDAQTPRPQEQAPVGEESAIGRAELTGAMNGGRLEGPFPVGSQYAGFQQPPATQIGPENVENLPIRQRQSYPMESAYDGRFPRYDTLSEQNLNEARGRRYPMPEPNIRQVQLSPGQASGDSSDAQARRSQQSSAPAVPNTSSTSSPGSGLPRRRDGNQQ